MEKNPSVAISVEGNQAQPLPPIRIIADDREVGAGVIEALKTLPEVEVAVERLTLGDYEVVTATYPSGIDPANRHSTEKILLFERKTLLDFTISITDGRLFSQAVRMAQSPKHSVLILEGTAGDLKDCAMRRAAIQGALIHLSLVLGIPILRSISPEESARLMLYAARQIRVIAHGGIHRSGYRPKGKLRRQLFVLQGLPGVGPKRAKELLDAFGSIEAVLVATTEELASVPGIGQRTAEEIRSLVSEAAAHYGTHADDLDV